MTTYEIIFRLLMAIVIAGGIGYERESRNRPAGFRTHILVCVGAAVIAMIQIQAVDDSLKKVIENPMLASAVKSDVGRMGAQVVSGIGFLGAGAIIHEKGSIKGLTTAASLWVVACIGLAVGMGYYVLAILSGVSVIAILGILKRFESKFLYKGKIMKIEIQYDDEKFQVQVLNDYFNRKKIKIKNIEYSIEDEDEESEDYNHHIKTSLYTILVPKYIKSGEVLHDIMGNDFIIKVSVL
ncbi:MgtC/SapB family protein [Clostridium algidicarnis]|uniref:MgtC/SapB family protein n=1 Tax=Clostridium algidicarnis TaxID=37659 RepID=UPI000496DE84|nr:MgtC/SapB family protein [Clostridium algidicarnis]MBB6631906.1 MgtC/SapB family protein [Clostridium algidicarnis]MBU3193672.1 MgtC/SapB family protein [Clostridium algidicarnis]MBU3197214.1 MgtC/SapB family protein [Clostridium algidicarnis]MBU3204879.1 MgtC/SapB family protein [Clostridium algidicarnis]MBU3207315.1 MgtC/SapB family protein [Clostridium algidicarnis]